METQNPTDTATPNATQQASKIVDALVEAGTSWAHYGVAVGQLAIKTQSAWLRGLSNVLNHVADAMDPLVRASDSKHSTPAES